jgi:hypothetical protein
MSSESEAGEIVSCELLVSGCDVSPILQLGEHALDDVSALLGGVITRVWRARTQVDLTRVRNGPRQLITRLFVDPGYQRAQVYRQQVQVVNMVLGGYRHRTPPIDVEEVGICFPGSPLKVKKSLRSS